MLEVNPMRAPVSRHRAAVFAATLAAAQARSAVPAQDATAASAVWQLREPGTAAGLRGIDAVCEAVAWAAGTEGRVPRTTGGGAAERVLRDVFDS
jgi:hypothetical protein